MEYYVEEPLACVEGNEDGNYQYIDSLDYGLLQKVPGLKSVIYFSELNTSYVGKKENADLCFMDVLPQTKVQYTMISIIEKEALEHPLLLQGNIVINEENLKE